MQDHRSRSPHFFGRAEPLFAEQGVTTATAAGLERETYGEWAERTRRLGGVLDDARHLRGRARRARSRGTPRATSSSTSPHRAPGRVLHTLNIRLFPEQLTYIVNHAEDEVIFVDRSLIRLLWPLVETFETVRHLVVMDDGKGDVPSRRRSARAPRLRGRCSRPRARSSSR